MAVIVRLSSGHERRALAPAGASVGQFEASVKRSSAGPYGQHGVEDAIAAAELAAARLTGLPAIPEIVDQELADIDGTDELEKLGGNTCVAISLAVAQAAAAASGQEFYRYLSRGRPVSLPLPMVNIFSGGRHAGGRLDFQDFLAVPLGARDFAEAMSMIWQVRRAAAKESERRGHDCALVADEGGFGVAFPSNREPLEVLTAAIESVGLEPGSGVGIAVDVAANELWRSDRYSLAIESRDLGSAEFLSELESYVDDYPAIVSIEDPFHDQDLAGWERAMERLGHRIQLLGDDLFATTAARVVASAGGWANSILIKPNQAGLLTRAKSAFEQARGMGMATVVSARSGDTEERWLADLAVGWSADQIKVGSLARAERTAKWNRLLEIEKLNPDATFVGASGLRVLSKETKPLPSDGTDIRE